MSKVGADLYSFAINDTGPLMCLEFFCWAFLNKGDYSPEEEEELEEYTRETELQLGRKLEPGRGTATPLRVTVDAVSTTYRSLFWYLVSGPRKTLNAPLRYTTSAFLWLT